MTTTSRLSGFHALSLDERRNALQALSGLEEHAFTASVGDAALPMPVADTMIENAIGTFALPLGVALNFRVNGRDVVVPMAVEEPSVVAAASNAALIARSGGGFHTSADSGAMIGQIQVVRVEDPERAAERVRCARPDLLARAASLVPGLVGRGAGPRDIEVRIVPTPRTGAMVVVHLIVDTGDAMGANSVNTLVEGLAPAVAELTGGLVCLRILSNLADRRLVRACVDVPLGKLARGDFRGEDVAERIVWAYELAATDPYRAATHNKGIMNGIDAVALATGNDWRAIEAGAHAYACRSGAYAPLSTWRIERDALRGELVLPMAVTTVGPAAKLHAGVRWALGLLGAPRAAELGGIMAAVGLASNLGALRALTTEGIQRGHMRLHARAVSYAAGARGPGVARVVEQLVAGGDVRLSCARNAVASAAAEPRPTADSVVDATPQPASYDACADASIRGE